MLAMLQRLWSEIERMSSKKLIAFFAMTYSDDPNCHHKKSPKLHLFSSFLPHHPLTTYSATSQ
jgi:hypothetical protein